LWLAATTTISRHLLFMSAWDARFMAILELRVDDGDEREMEITDLELSSGNPGVDRVMIHALVQQAYDRLTPARVHDFLPILIGREVQAGLRAHEVR